MSLTSFLKIPNIRAEFVKTFPFSSPKLYGKLLAPPQTKHYSLIGTAFDYLLRFHLERLNPSALKKSWVAETAVDLTKPELNKKLQPLIEMAKIPYSDYIKNGKLSESLFAATIILAKLDLIYRAGIMEPNLMDYENDDVLDLKNLLSIVDDSMFKSKKFCTLNPIFNDASLLVGGADADVIIDDTLIDIKTTKNLKFQREHYDQLIGYYILSKLGHIDGMKGKINNIGIYFSRHGVLHTIPTYQIDENPNFDLFVNWFEKEARSVFGN